MARWQARELSSRRGLRVTPSDHLHVTAVFLGSQPADRAEPLAGLLRACASRSLPPEFTVQRYRESPRAGMLVLAEASGGTGEPAGRAGALTDGLMRTLEAQGWYRRDHRGWAPHLTVARFRTPPRLTPGVPDLPAFTCARIALFESRLAPGGSTYQVLASVTLA